MSVCVCVGGGGVRVCKSSLARSIPEGKRETGVRVCVSDSSMLSLPAH